MFLPWLRGPMLAEEPGDAGPGGGSGIDPASLSPFDAPPPETGISQAPPTPTVPVEIGGRTIQLSPEDAEALQQRLASVDELRGQLDSTTTQLDQMRGDWQRMQGVFNPTPAEPDLATQFYTDPNAAMQGLEDRIVTRVTAANKVEKTRESFWTTFYGEHPELKSFDDLVQLTLANDQSVQQTPNTPDGRQKLADAVQARALAINQQFGGTTAPRVRMVEGGGTARRQPATPAAEPEGPTSIGAMTKRRREQKRTGSTG